MGDYGPSDFLKEKTIIFQQDGQIYMYTYTHQDHHTQLRRLFIHLTQVFKKIFAHKIFNQIMIKLRRDKYDLGYGFVYPPIEQTFMEHVLCTRHCARFWGIYQSPAREPTLPPKSWYLNDKQSSYGRSWGKNFPI